MDTLRNNKNLWMLYDTEVPHRRFCDPARGAAPAEKLGPEHLQHLRKAFTCLKEEPPTGPEDEARHRAEEPGVKLEEFRELLRSVIGPSTDDSWVERFFNEVDICCRGEVKWEQLCSYLVLEYSERQRTSVPTAALLNVQPQIRHCFHNKREPTVRVVPVFHPPPLRYVSVSKGGQITIWNSSLHVIRTLTLAGDPTEEAAKTTRFRGWTTDAAYMGTCQKVAIATDRRDLHFVRVSPTTVIEDVHLFGFRCVLTALCYSHDAQCAEKPPLLILGDEKGGVHLMWFLKPSKGLFKSPSKKEKGPQRIFFPDLTEHRRMVSHQHIPNLHQEPINRVIFEAGSNVIMTSSESDTTSVVFIDVSQKQQPYVWKISQGVKCFDYDSSLQLLVTGGCDRKVRLWTRYVTSTPAGTLLGHRTAVLDVAVCQPVGQIFSYSRDSDLRVWDISSHQCLKTVRLQFPCLQPGLIPEHGNFPFLLLSPPLPEETQPHLLVGCKDYLAHVKLAETGRGGELGAETPLSCALYNPTLRQVVTGHVDSSVSLWDVETGRRRLHILNAHGEEELSCMELDSSHRRLITGARNGTIKVWNLFSGLNLHRLEPVNNLKVSDLTCLHGNQLLAVGWSQSIAQYNIGEVKDLKVRADTSWKCNSIHRSDILMVRQCSSLGVIATASHDGQLVVWRLETQEPFLHLRRGTQAQAALPVNDLLFLQCRAADRKLRDAGVLVSSQAGCLCFWSLAAEKHANGVFYAPERPGECVLSLSSDQTKNSLLVSGDTAGRLQIWDISSFALDFQPGLAGERPPLLQHWNVHKRLVCVKALDVADRVFILTASTDGSAGLWTLDGDHVGYFGQQVMWSITDPATYHRRRNNLTENPGERTERDKLEQSEVKNGLSDQGPTSQEERGCSEVSPAGSSPAIRYRRTGETGEAETSIF